MPTQALISPLPRVRFLQMCPPPPPSSSSSARAKPPRTGAAAHATRVGADAAQTKAVIDIWGCREPLKVRAGHAVATSARLIPAAARGGRAAGEADGGGRNGAVRAAEVHRLVVPITDLVAASSRGAVASAQDLQSVVCSSAHACVRDGEERMHGRRHQARDGSRKRMHRRRHKSA